jgi:hypothetical protein
MELLVDKNYLYWNRQMIGLGTLILLFVYQDPFIGTVIRYRGYREKYTMMVKGYETRSLVMTEVNKLILLASLLFMCELTKIITDMFGSVGDAFK